MPSGTKRGMAIGIGIDLLNLSKVKRLFHGHKKQAFQNLFTPSEQKILSQRPSSQPSSRGRRGNKFSPLPQGEGQGEGRMILRAARLLAAKEAFFKASSLTWMGPDGFKDIEVKCFPGSRFQVQSLIAPVSGKGCFFEREQLVGAQVIVWR